MPLPENRQNNRHSRGTIWAKQAKEEGILIGEERGIKLGEERGKAEERQKNIRNVIDMCNSLGVPREAIVNQLVKCFNLSCDEAVVLVDKKLS